MIRVQRILKMRYLFTKHKNASRVDIEPFMLIFSQHEAHRAEDEL